MAPLTLCGSVVTVSALGLTGPVSICPSIHDHCSIVVYCVGQTEKKFVRTVKDSNILPFCRNCNNKKSSLEFLMMLHAYSGNVVLGVGGSQTTLGSLYLSEGINSGMYKK